MLVFLLAAGALMFSLHHLGGCYVSKQIMILKIFVTCKCENDSNAWLNSKSSHLFKMHERIRSAMMNHEKAVPPKSNTNGLAIKTLKDLIF